MRLPSTEEKAHNICIFLPASFNIVFSFKYQKASTRVDSTEEELECSGLLVMAKQQHCWSRISALGLSFTFDTSLWHDGCRMFSHPFCIQGRKEKQQRYWQTHLSGFIKIMHAFPETPIPTPVDSFSGLPGQNQVTWPHSYKGILWNQGSGLVYWFRSSPLTAWGWLPRHPELNQGSVNNNGTNHGYWVGN